MLKIYGRANSINVRKVLWACSEMQIPFGREDWGRGFRSTEDPDFARVSRFGVVPVIDDGGFVLRESNTIVRYLASKHDRQDLLPSEPQQRFAVEAWMDWASTDLYQDVRPVFQGLVFKLPQFSDPKVIENGIIGWTRQMQLLSDHLAVGGSYMMGPVFTAADIPVGLIVNRWFETPFDRLTLPVIEAYYQRLKERPGYREYGANGTP
ncbi:MAG: glutathione S-transferase family protein [Hyphomicrobiaceae bacterium]